MNAKVKSQVGGLRTGNWKVGISSQGMTLWRKNEERVQIATGTPARYLGGSKAIFKVPAGEVELNFNSFVSRDQQFARDMVDWISNPSSAPVPNLDDFKLNGWMALLVLLPFGIPFLTLGGAVPVLIAIGLFALNKVIAQSNVRSQILRSVACLATTLPFYALAGWLLFSAMEPGSSRSNKDRRYGQFAYKKTGKEVMISKYYPDGSTKVEIPRKIRGKLVTRIGGKAFKGSDKLRSITIPEGVTHIDKHAFGDCSNLKYVNFPKGLLEIGIQGFQGCDSLEEVTLPDSLHTIGSFAFDRCHGLRMVRNLGRVPEVSRSCFKGCKSLTEVVIPESVTKIGESAFEACSALRTIRFPDGLKEVGPKAFYKSAVVEIDLPDSVRVIGGKSFHDCIALKKVRLSAGVTSVPDKAFSGCLALTHIELPQSLVKIGEEAFKECKSMTEIHLPAQLSVVGKYGFLDCSALKNVSGGEGLEVYEHGALQGCISLESFPVLDGPS